MCMLERQAVTCKIGKCMLYQCESVLACETVLILSGRVFTLSHMYNIGKAGSVQGCPGAEEPSADRLLT